MLEDLTGYEIPSHRPCCRQCALALRLIVRALQGVEIRRGDDNTLSGEALALAVAKSALGELTAETVAAAGITVFALREKVN